MAASARALLRGGGRRAVCSFSSSAVSHSCPPPEFSSLPAVIAPSSPALELPSSLPSFVEGSMQLMAVPKKKVSPHKRGIRNGPKALKPAPVIVRCKSCGRVKLPHFYCCSGERRSPGEEPAR